MKKILCFVTSLAMCGMFAVSAHAAEGITADEQAILDNLKTGVVVNGTSVTVPSDYITQAESYLSTNDVTAEQAKAINAEIETVREIVKAEGITNINQIKGDVATKIFNHAQKAASTVGLTLKVNASKDIEVLDATGKAVFTLSNPMKDTGDDYSSMFAMTGAIALLLAGAGVVASKKGYFAK